MCDQTEVSYLEDDIVWVKIGPIWWPGVVKDLEKDDEGKEILAGLKKKPIAVVKFFQEDNYEFVKNLDCIYHYNCRKKDEFIKKGLDKFRAGAPHMKKFPADVTTAESLTNGDINIINDPKFLPEKKESYSEIFGSGKKKTKKEGEITSRPRHSRASANLTPYRPITHQRFINKVLSGESDHRVKTLIQMNTSADESPSKNPYKCHICKFETSRVNVIVAHHRLSHSSKNSINWTGSDSRLIRKKPIYKSRKLKAKKLFDTSVEDFSDDDIPDKKKTVKSKSPKEKVKSSDRLKTNKSSLSPSKRRKEIPSEETSGSKKPRFTDVLLADWNEDFEEEKKEEQNDKGTESSDTKTDIQLDEGENKNENASLSVDSPDNHSKNQTGKISCFDFDEEEEGFIGMSNANTYGRKIPRVIPVKDKSELGMDLEIDELFDKKNDSDSETGKEEVEKQEEIYFNENATRAEAEELIEKNDDPKPALATRRRRSKANKEEEQKKSAENSLAMTRTRRPGAKKSYLNEVIEKLEDDESKSEKMDETFELNSDVAPEGIKVATLKTEASSSSRRKQDFKNQTMDSEREEFVYSDIVKSEQKPKAGEGFDKKKGKHQNSRKERKDDFTTQIDILLEETKPSQLPENINTCEKVKAEKEEETKSNANNFSFDYLQTDQSGQKCGKSRMEVKSISRMFGDSIPNAELVSEGDSPNIIVENAHGVVPSEASQSKILKTGTAKVSQGSNVTLKRGSIVLSTALKSNESPVKSLPVTKQVTSPKECIVLPGGKKTDGKEEVEQPFEVEHSQRVKNIKTIKVKPDSLPSSLLSGGKLKGQTIIHQKSGKYVIVTQPPQVGQKKVTPGKVQAGSKVVILTNQHGEQKIITTSGLQQSKFKVEGSKMVTTTDSATGKETLSSASTSQSQSQPVIKMVPDGKGGIMKQLTVSPKKVLLGGTKMLVSGSGSSLSAGNSVQKIALSSGSGVAKTGDFRLIENYKGSGKTILIQGSSNGGGVVLKSSAVGPRSVTKVIQSPQGLPTLKTKPKILMRASGGQEEYLMQSGSGTVDSPTYMVKQKGLDGKLSTQKIVRTEVLNQGKISSSGLGTKRIFVSGQGSNKKVESFLIATNETVPSKVIRMRQKIKEVDGAITSKTPPKSVSKNPELYAVPQNSILLPSQGPTETETTQIVQVQDQAQQPVLQTQVIAMPGPVGADGNQTYVLVSVDENGVFQGVDNSVVAFDASAQPDQIFINSTSTGNVMLLNSQTTEEVVPVFSTSSQDILAEALANTNVLEGNLNSELDTVVPSILLPPSIPSSVVQETSITLQKPIMTPLEMPSSVAPDTSGLEPPPLPPTPTDEDVLMEESEICAVQTPVDGEKEKKVNSDETGGTAFAQSEEFLKKGSQLVEGRDANEHVLGENDEEPFQQLTKEDFEQEQEPTSFQSMPLLSDEPDTSDDVGSDPIPDQHFDAQRARIEAAQLSRLIREQEPPSSTINETNTEYIISGEPQPTGGTSCENEEPEMKKKETEEKQDEEGSDEQEQQHQVKDMACLSKETQSMPVIIDETNGTASDLEPLYSDVMSQKRFQEETEVSSTTDEYSTKELTH